MKSFTEEQITAIVNEVATNVNTELHNDFLKATEQIPEDLKNNPLAYTEMAMALSIAKSTTIIKESLCKLLSE